MLTSREIQTSFTTIIAVKCARNLRRLPLLGHIDIDIRARTTLNPEQLAGTKNSPLVIVREVDYSMNAGPETIRL